jgi:hypothetical protein
MHKLINAAADSRVPLRGDSGKYMKINLPGLNNTNPAYSLN